MYTFFKMSLELNLVLLTAMFEGGANLFLNSHCIRIQQTNVWRHLLAASKQFNCFCKPPNFHTLFKILFVSLPLYLNVLFEPLACLQKSVFHSRAIVPSQEPWKSATKCSQYDAVLLIIYNTLVIMYTKLQNSKLHGLSPRANYTNRATAAYQRSDCQLLRIEGCYVVSVTDPYCRILGFLDRSPYFSLK
jgi:hypothetical protein